VQVCVRVHPHILVTGEEDLERATRIAKANEYRALVSQPGNSSYVRGDNPEMKVTKL
jgi:hypothetical protein